MTGLAISISCLVGAWSGFQIGAYRQAVRDGKLQSISSRIVEVVTAWFRAVVEAPPRSTFRLDCRRANCTCRGEA